VGSGDPALKLGRAADIYLLEDGSEIRLEFDTEIWDGRRAPGAAART
jgi:hypothetical protein